MKPFSKYVFTPLFAKGSEDTFFSGVGPSEFLLRGALSHDNRACVRLRLRRDPKQIDAA